MRVCDWNNLEAELDICASKISENKPVTQPFHPLTFFDKPELHLLSAKTYAASKCSKHPVLSEIPRRQITGKVKLGFFSADLYYHPVAIWLAEQLENHDKSKFELFAFSFRSDKNDPMKSRLVAAFDHFIEVDKMSDQQVTELSRQLGIDIALDLGGYTAESRPNIFASRAAPIQVNHLGFPGSMGADFIDYLISDFHSVTDSSRKYYTEKVIYVPCAYTYDRQRQLSSLPMTRSQFSLPDRGFVFTCQNGCQKITPEVFDIWMDILKAVPGSVLWLLEPNATAVNNLRKEAQSRGVQSERLVFTPREAVPVDQEKERIERYLASYQLADLFLDTWPYNAGTTGVDALWAGLPVLTKCGEAAVARMATSALHAIEMPEMVTYSAQQYRQLAIDLALEPQKLSAIKDKLQHNRFTTALFDPVTNTKHIESAYLQMIEQYNQ
jgi:predicted O-linked N-acetylglucosamine transferase (SPINDLY family)